MRSWLALGTLVTHALETKGSPEQHGELQSGTTIYLKCAVTVPSTGHWTLGPGLYQL